MHLSEKNLLVCLLSKDTNALHKPGMSNVFDNRYRVLIVQAAIIQVLHEKDGSLVTIKFLKIQLQPAVSTKVLKNYHGCYRGLQVSRHYT